MKKILVLGAGGFIGNHLVNVLKDQGHYVVGVDQKRPEFSKSNANKFHLRDLRNFAECYSVFNNAKFLYDEVYQLAADMGGAGYIFSGAHDADVMSNSALINLNVAKACLRHKVGKLFYSSSACVYPAYNQLDAQNPKCAEETAYPAAPDSEYGWEKLFSERLYLAYARNHGLNVRIARFHNIFGPQGTYQGGKEKAPAALCRKVAEAKDGDQIEVWGDGQQTRSFLYIDECIEGILRLMQSDFTGPVNIGSEDMVTLNHLAKMIIDYSGKNLTIKNVETTMQGVRGRNSDNALIWEKLGWQPRYALTDGVYETYNWINKQVNP